MESHVHAAAGDRGKAEQLLAELKEISRRRYVCAYEIAHTYVKLGDKKQALHDMIAGTAVFPKALAPSVEPSPAP